MARLQSKDKREKSISEMLKKYDAEVHPVGEGLPDDVRIYRIKVLTFFLKAGVPLNKIDCFRDLFEESSYRLTTSSHLSEMISIIHREEEAKLKSDIHERKVSVIFDGTTHVCEAMVIVLRFIDNQWSI